MSAPGTTDRQDDAGEQERLRALAALGVSPTEPEERFDRITRLAKQRFGVAIATVSLIDHDTQWYKSRQGVDFSSVPREFSFCNHTIRRADTLVVEDMHLDERFRHHPYVDGDPRARFYAGHPLEASGGQRVGTLCLIDTRPRAFGPADQALLRELAQWAETEMTHSVEMTQAARVQQSLMPRGRAVLPGYEIAGMCLPARAVGGDFVDWYPQPDGSLVLTLADVMGKGLGAAIMMATVRAALRTAGRVARPSEAVRNAAAALDDDLQRSGMLVTLLQARLDGHSGELTWADAGHGLLVVVRADGAAELPSAGGLPLGTVPDDRWPEQTVELGPGDTVVAFSDGLLDLGDGTLSVVDDIVALVRSGADAAALVSHFVAVAGRVVLTDDVTLVVARRLPGGGR